MLFPFFIPLFDMIKPKEGEVFWDIGCGAARPLAIAALNFPMLSKCCGVELLEGLYNLAEDTANQIRMLKETKFQDIVPIEVFKGDMLELDWWSTADIVYASSICFPDSLIEGIVEKCALLKKGARVITLKSFSSSEGGDTPSYLRLDYTLKLKMTWGRCEVLIYTIV